MNLPKVILACLHGEFIPPANSKYQVEDIPRCRLMAMRLLSTGFEFSRCKVKGKWIYTVESTTFHLRKFDCMPRQRLPRFPQWKSYAVSVLVGALAGLTFARVSIFFLQLVFGS